MGIEFVELGSSPTGAGGDNLRQAFVKVNASLTFLAVSASKVDLNAQSGTSYTLILTDAGKLVTCDNASPVMVTIPTNAAVAFPVGTTVAVSQLGVGVVTIKAATGVTINGVSGGGINLSERYGSAALVKLGTDSWLVSGAVESVVV